MGVHTYPGVFASEKDLSQIVTNSATAICATVGAAPKGPINARSFVTNTQAFVNLFGKPDVNYGYAQYCALCALETTNQMYFTRVANGARYSGKIVNKSGTTPATNNFAVATTVVQEDLPESGAIATVGETVGTANGTLTVFTKSLVNGAILDSIQAIKVNNVALGS